MLRKTLVALAATLFVFGEPPTRSQAQTSTECSKNGFCYCVASGMKDAIAQRIVQIRARISDQRAQGKSIGYLSVPVSTFGGSYFGVNIKIATQAKERIEERLGVRSAWVLNPAASEFSLPRGASGADYDSMWTQILEGASGTGDDFDFVHFVGPSDYSRFFGLDGKADMEKIERYFDELSTTDLELRKVEKRDFRNYYALRAGASYSVGSHDEWNIVRSINEQRRKASGDDKQDAGKDKPNRPIYGVGRQLAVFFDGRGVAPGLFETPVASGYAAPCPGGAQSGAGQSGGAGNGPK